jgi:hypothetical protein
MADAGVGEAAILAAVAPEVIGGAAAAGTTAATTAAALAAMAPEAIGAAGALAGTAAVAPEIAAAAVPSLALAVPEVAAVTVPTAAEAAATLAPTAAEPIFLGGTTTEPLLGAGVQGGAVTDASLLGPAAAPADVPLVTPSGVTVGTEAYGPQEAQGLLGKIGTWWDKATLGEKLKAGGTVLSGVSTAAKAASPSTPSSGPKTTIRPGTTGKPMGGEQALAQVVEALLKRRDAYTGGQSGVPVAYRPRGLLG